MDTEPGYRYILYRYLDPLPCLVHKRPHTNLNIDVFRELWCSLESGRFGCPWWFAIVGVYAEDEGKGI